MGCPRGALDTIVAAIAQSNRCIVVTDNKRGFYGIDIINTLRGNATRNNWETWRLECATSE